MNANVKLWECYREHWDMERGSMHVLGRKVCKLGLSYIYKCLICKFVSACVSVCTVNTRVCGQCWSGTHSGI